MINRRQFAKRTTSTLITLKSASLWSAAKSLSSFTDGPVAEFHLRDYLGIYDFPEELLSYSLSFPAGAIKKGDLRLLPKGGGAPVVIQFGDIVEEGGFLRKATLYFRTSLKRSEEKTFELIRNVKTPAPDLQPIVLQIIGDGRASIQADQLQVLVPSGHDHTLNLPVSQVPPPLLAVARERGKWVGAGKLDGPSNLVALKMDTRVVEDGPLFLRYAITYTFPGDRSYTMELRVQHGETHVEIDEYMTLLGPDDHLDFQFSYKQGVDPNGRLLMANGGYSTGGSQQGASGAYDQGTNPQGKLPIKLGIYTPNSINLPRAIAFWNDHGENAILFALRRLPDWKTSRRALWSSSDLPDNLEFYAKPNGGDTFLRAAIVGNERHWAIGLVPRDAMVVCGIELGKTGLRPPPPDKVWNVDSSMKGILSYGGGPEVRLLQKLTDFSLNLHKEWIFEFPEDGRTASFSLPYNDFVPTPMTGADYYSAYARHYAFLAQVGWDFSGELGGIHWGHAINDQSLNYAYNYTKWTPAENLQLRSWLVFAAYLMGLDTAAPQTSMLAGHPNFVAQWKQILGVIAGLFPLHPHARRWRDTYLSFWEEYLDKYVHKGDPETGARAGRFTENITCYNYASMEAVYSAAAGFKQFDGTQILDRPIFREWARWDMESRLPFMVDGARVVPPEGAHAMLELLTPGGHWNHVAHGLAQLMKDTEPVLANQWLWMITNGSEGKKPETLQSSVFNDYGPVFRYDFDGPNEAYLHVQQLHGLGYRWGQASNGAVYFAAKGKVWSWNQIETNGDGFDITKISLLQVGNASLGASLATGVLYDFGFAQYYNAEASPDKGAPAYKARGLMMVRGDYVAIRDEIDSQTTATFHWVNETNGLPWQIFADTEFQKPIKTFDTDWRFPLSFGPPEIKLMGITSPVFSVRTAGKFAIPVAGKYLFRTRWNDPKHDVPAGDTVRIYLDDQKMFDGKGPSSIEMELEARTYAIRFEYIHASAEAPFLMVSWTWQHHGEDKPRSGQIENAYFLTEHPMPFIQQMKGGPGDQLHIVSPEKIDIASVTDSAAQIGAHEYVLFGDAEVQKPGKTLRFAGKAGYAKEGELALFVGSHIELNGFGLSTEGGEFGASARSASTHTIEGHIAGKSGGQLRIHLPAGFPTRGLKGTFDGKDIPVALEGSNVSIPVTIRQSDGVKTYKIIG